MFHSVCFNFDSPIRLDGRQLKEYLDSVNTDNLENWDHHRRPKRAHTPFGR